MLSLFKKKKRGTSPLTPVWMKVDGVLKKQQRKLADKLQEKSNQYTVTTLKYFLFLFCAVFAAACLYVTWHSFQASRQYKRPAQISIPKHVIDGKKTDTAVMLNLAPEYIKIQRFKNYMAELGKTPDGRKTADSILRARPGLMDSIQLVENILKQQ